MKLMIIYTDVFANKAKESIKEEQKESVELIEYKENIFKRILNKIKVFFTKKWSRTGFFFLYSLFT